MVETSFQLVAHDGQREAFYGKGDAGSKMTNTGDICYDGALMLANALQVAYDLFKVLSRKPVKHGQVRAQEVALRGEMRLAEIVKHLKIGLGNPSGEDQGMACLQLRSALPRLEQGIVRERNRSPRLTPPRRPFAVDARSNGCASRSTKCDLHPVPAGVLGLVECHVSFPVGFGDVGGRG